MTRTISLSIDSRPECIELLSCALYGLCQLTGLPATEVARIDLAMVEAANNAVEHAYGGESGHPVVVEFHLMPERFCLVVLDRGAAMDSRQLDLAGTFGDPDFSDPDTWSIRGRGLAIIKSCMDVVEYHTRDGLNALSMSRTLGSVHPA